MKTKIVGFLRSTQKATAALLGAATAVASATFIPEPYNHYASVAVVVLTWLATYLVPYLTKAVDEWPDDELDWGPEMSDEEWNALLADLVAAPESPVEPVLEGDLLDPYPSTVEIPVIAHTAGIPVIEGEGAEVEGLTVDELINRLASEDAN